MLHILKEIIGEVNFPQKTIGNKVYFELDDKRRVEIGLYETRVSNDFDRIVVKLIHKDLGVLHVQDLDFRDVFDCIQDRRGLGKHVYRTNMKYAWYGVPTHEDIQKFNAAISNYISLWI